MATNAELPVEDLKPKRQMQRAQQFDNRDNKLHLNEIPIPELQPHQLLIKIACASLCHSDVMLFEPNDAGLVLGKNPITLGHEATGFVAEVGSGVKPGQFKPGDKVGFLPAQECCYECHPCREVHNNYCVTGRTVNCGFAVDGFFQEYVAVDARSAMVLPESLDVFESAPLFCAGVTSYHAVADCELKPGQWVAIVGCGGLGHLGIQYAKAMALKVIAVDITEGALQEAKAQGADYAFNSMTEKDYVRKIREITGGGVDAAINFTASAKAYGATPDLIKPGFGLLMCVGIPRFPIELNALDVALGRYRVKGASNGTNFNMRPCIEFSAKHNIRSHTTMHRLEELPDMVQLMLDHKSVGRLAVQFK